MAGLSDEWATRIFLLFHTQFCSALLLELLYLLLVSHGDITLSITSATQADASDTSGFFLKDTMHVTVQHIPLQNTPLG